MLSYSIYFSVTAIAFYSRVDRWCFVTTTRHVVSSQLENDTKMRQKKHVSISPLLDCLSCDERNKRILILCLFDKNGTEETCEY